MRPALSAAEHEPLALRVYVAEFSYHPGALCARWPTQNHFDQALSTKRRQAGILMDVHWALPKTS